MHLQNPRENIVELTRLSPFERFPDGRPRVPDDLLERVKQATTEEAWRVLRDHGYHYQFEGNWLNLHPDQILVGRAVTTVFLPMRPDLNDLVEEQGKVDGRIGAGKQNSWVIDTLVPGDVLVVDLRGKVKYGTFVGDNLSTAVRARGGAGIVIDGGIRDLQRVMRLPDFGVFIRGVDPTPIRDLTLAGINVPIQIGSATVLPGDVVLGTPTGVLFIPSHLVQEVVESSELVRLRDQFGQQRLREGRYTPGQIDVGQWEPEIEADFLDWRRGRSG